MCSHLAGFGSEKHSICKKVFAELIIVDPSPGSLFLFATHPLTTEGH